MNEKLKLVIDKYNLLGLRERLLILACVYALLYLLCDFGFLQGTSNAIDHQREVEQQLIKKIELSRAELKVFESAIRKDPNAQLKMELAALKNKLEQLDQNLSSLSVGMISADSLPMMLHDILSHNKNLKLMGLKTLPAEEIKIGGPGGDSKILKDQAEDLDNGVLAQSLKDTDAANYEEKMLARAMEEEGIKVIRLFKHGVTMDFKGTYEDVTQYIKLLEEGDWRFYWDGLKYKVDNYPVADITMKVYTLSNERSAFDGLW